MRSIQDNNSNQKIGLYNNYVTVLKILQIIGYFLGVISGIRLGTQVGFGAGIFAIIFSVAINYIATQGFIAIIELLSRIEYNTRSLRNQDDQE
jgi:hypothetical protein